MKSANRKFPEDELSRIDKANNLKISPFREDGVTYGTPTWIWAVVVKGNLYVRAYNGVKSTWYRSAIQQKAGRIVAAGMTIEVKFSAVKGEIINRQIDEAYKLKYRKSKFLSPMISKRVKAATIKIIPQ